MNMIVKVLAGLLCLLFIAMGVQSMFTPEWAIAQFGVTPDSAHGLNTLRGDLGGFCLLYTSPSPRDA